MSRFTSIDILFGSGPRRYDAFSEFAAGEWSVYETDSRPEVRIGGMACHLLRWRRAAVVGRDGPKVRRIPTTAPDPDRLAADTAPEDERVKRVEIPICPASPLFERRHLPVEGQGGKFVRLIAH